MPKRFKNSIFVIQKKVRILSNTNIIGNYYRLDLNVASISRQAKPGQFLQIKVSDGVEPLLRRPFSIHRIINKNIIEILYEVVGKGTQILSQRKAGEYLDIIAPLGNGFDYTLYAKRYTLPILIAGGMGVVPLVFLAEKLITHNSKLITVLIGAKTKTEILCEKEFQDLGCEVKIATDDGSEGFKGKATDLLKNILRTTHNAQRTTLYACGPRLMLKEISIISKQYNIPAQVSLEEHMACGIGACLGCVIKTKNQKPKTKNDFIYQRVCKEGPVFNAEKIIW